MNVQSPRDPNGIPLDVDMPPPPAAKSVTPHAVIDDGSDEVHSFIPLSAPLAAPIEQPLATAPYDGARRRTLDELPEVTADYSAFTSAQNETPSATPDDGGSSGPSRTLFDLNPEDWVIPTSAPLAPIDARPTIAGAHEVFAAKDGTPLETPGSFPAAVEFVDEFPEFLVSPETAAAAQQALSALPGSWTESLSPEAVHAQAITTPTRDRTLRLATPAPEEHERPDSTLAELSAPRRGLLPTFSARTKIIGLRFGEESGPADDVALEVTPEMPHETHDAATITVATTATPAEEMLSAAALDMQPVRDLSTVATASPAQQPASRKLFGLDWRMAGLIATYLSFVPLIIRSLLEVRPSNVLGFTVVAPMLLPIMFVVFATRRPRRQTIDDRHVDLVVGIGLAVAAIVMARVVPRTVSSGSTLWRADWLSLPLALAAAYVLLWGLRFAWDMRNTTIVAVLASPLLLIPLFDISWLPLGGRLNAVAVSIASAATRLTPVSFGRFEYVGETPTRDLDVRGLIDGRNLVVALLVLLVSALLASRIEGRSRADGGPASAAVRRVRKLGVLVGCLVTWWTADVVVTTIVLLLGSVMPASVRTALGSVVVGAIPVIVAAWSFRRWIRVLQLFLPSVAGIRKSSTALPSHGPKSRSDHIISITTLSVVALSTVATTLWPSSGTARPIPLAASAPSTISDENDRVLPTPGDWKPIQVALYEDFHAYFGARSRWQRTNLEATVSSPLDQVAVDAITGPTQLLRTFGVPAVFELGQYVPVRRSQVNLGDGFVGEQESFYDETTASTWSIVTFYVTDGNTTTKIMVSGRGAGDASNAPNPEPSAAANLNMRIARPNAGVGQELKEQKVEQTTLAVAALSAAQADALRIGTTVADVDLSDDFVTSETAT